MAVPEMGVLHIFSIPLCTSRPLTTDVKMSKTSCFLRREAKQRKRRRPWKWRKNSWMVMRFLEKQRNPEKWRETWRNVRILRFQSQDSRIQEKGVLHEGCVRTRPRKNAKEFNSPPKLRRWNAQGEKRATFKSFHTGRLPFLPWKWKWVYLQYISFLSWKG